MKLPVSVVESFDDIQRVFEWLSTRDFVRADQALELRVGSGSATIASGMADTMVTPGFATACVMFWAAVNPVTNADITMYSLIIGRDGYIRTKSPVSQTINYQWAALGN